MDPCVTPKDLHRIFWRSLFLESAWNFETMQSVGYLHVMLPVYRRLSRTAQELASCVRRGLMYFNTNPHTSTILFGILANLEERRVRGEGVSERDIDENFKRTYMGPLAALGDNLFWATLRPLAAMIGVAAALIEDEPFPAPLWGVFLFLLIFNLPHLVVRWWGLVEGYKKGDSFVLELQEIDFQSIIEQVRLVAVITIGAFLPVLLFMSNGVDFFPLQHYPWLKLLVFGGALLWFKIEMTSTSYFLIMVLACLVLSVTGIVGP